MLMRFTKGGGFKPPLRAALTAALLALPAAACEGLLDVADEDVTKDEFLENETAIPALRAAVVGDFIPAYEQLMVHGGMLGDEYRFSETFPTRFQIDLRRMNANNGTLLDLFALATTAGATADFVSERYNLADPGGAAVLERAEAKSLGGYALLALAENYCSGVPISRVNRSSGGQLEFRYGAPLTTTQLVDSAIARFDAALALLPGNAGSTATQSQRNLARVGKARALLYRGNGDAAAAAAVVAQVPDNFTFQLEHSDNSTAEESFPWFFNISNERVSLSNNEGGTFVDDDDDGVIEYNEFRKTSAEGLPFLEAGGPTQPGGRDPRVLWRRRGTVANPESNLGFDGVTPLYDALKYQDRTSFTVLASGVEARLIEAEAQFRAGNAAGMIATLNALRAQVQPLMQLLSANYPNQQQLAGYQPGQGAVLAPLALPATAAEQRDLLFRERAYWLYLTGHRLPDMRRLVRQYGLNQAQVFPTGTHPKNQAYGTDVNFPIPVQEQNNPTSGAGQCIDRAA